MAGGELDVLLTELGAQFQSAETVADLEALKVAVFGKSGRLTLLLRELSKIDPSERKARGKALNELRASAQAVFDERMELLRTQERAARLLAESVDVTATNYRRASGRVHPLTRTFDEIRTIFQNLGFACAQGPDIETQWHNFSALNTPDHHPARSEQDTFFLPPCTDKEGKDGALLERVLRTQTSGVQIRTMLAEKPPIKIIAPGRVYRADHDATHSPMFHQCEGLVVSKTANLAALKELLGTFLKIFFNDPKLNIRFRPSYFPFTEPSFEVDIEFTPERGEKRWLEVLGAGMTHPRVLANCGIDPREWRAFAFGMGIERLAMIKYGISDLRSLFEQDVRWLERFGFSPFK